MNKRFDDYPLVVFKVGVLLCGLFSILLSITGCRNPDPQTHQEALASALAEQANLPTNWAESNQEPPLEAGWLTRFEDPGLNAYVDQVIKHNLSLRALIYRVEASAAAARKSGAPLLPSIVVSGTGQRRSILITTRICKTALAN